MAIYQVIGLFWILKALIKIYIIKVIENSAKIDYIPDKNNILIP